MVSLVFCCRLGKNDAAQCLGRTHPAGFRRGDAERPSHDKDGAQTDVLRSAAGHLSVQTHSVGDIICKW